MADERTIQEEMEQMESLQVLTRSYEEIASTRMKKVRERVLAKRDFLQEINSVFEEVRDSYARQVLSLYKKKGIKKTSGKVTLLSHNGKTVSVLLSANSGLYGSIIPKTFRMFIEAVRNSDSEATIVGRQGLSLFLQEEPNKPYTYFDLPDYASKSSDLSEIIRHIVQYERISVYYGKFVNVVDQSASVYTISAEIDLDKTKEKVETLYLFEPSLEKILMFFESEIFASLFEQTVNESELSKSASRMLAMNQAADNIQNYLKELKVEKLKAAHKSANRKQLNSLSGLYMR